VNMAHQRQIDISVGVNPEGPVVDFFRLRRSDQNLVVGSQHVVGANGVWRKLLNGRSSARRGGIVACGGLWKPSLSGLKRLGLLSQYRDNSRQKQYHGGNPLPGLIHTGSRRLLKKFDNRLLTRSAQNGVSQHGSSLQDSTKSAPLQVAQLGGQSSNRPNRMPVHVGRNRALQEVDGHNQPQFPLHFRENAFDARQRSAFD